MTTLSDTSKLWVYFNVPEAEYLDYKLHQSEDERIKHVQIRMANGQIFNQSGVIETIEADFDNSAGNIEFRATFPNPDRLLRHGETGTILMVKPYKNALLIPQKAVFDIMDKSYVYVINKEGKLEQDRSQYSTSIYYQRGLTKRRQDPARGFAQSACRRRGKN